MATNLYDITIDGRHGTVMHMSDYKGKVVMLVNTASECGYTKQYAGLETLWKKYREQGLVIIGIPTNDFGKQEPGNDDQIAEFCTINFGVTFPLTTKLTSKGDDKHAVFTLIRDSFGLIAGPNWNFHKYIFDKNGEPVDWFFSRTEPLSEKIIKTVEEQLNRDS